MATWERIGSMEQFWQLAETMEQGFLFAMLTDEVVLERWPLSEEGKKNFRAGERKLLDIRIFNQERELRMFRGNVGGAFRGRALEDGTDARGGRRRSAECRNEEFRDEEFWDEEQYLDIDTERSETLFAREGMVQTAGGGRYRLPLEGFVNAKIRIRNYLDYYEETGQAYVKDWRLTDLFQEEG
ncbi:MAG: CRISPR-associated protein Csx19 [Clostridium sp.]|nr:CRISPR-associated protein Csx19 [Acetatifactor muris]MCM1527277.1 CRISPR-associated protein Csx19 [Bacteroides sp.]MCM1563029.1 CRISPR-associated protein Csx19 [Clostridium sp.]